MRPCRLIFLATLVPCLAAAQESDPARLPRLLNGRSSIRIELWNGDRETLNDVRVLNGIVSGQSRERATPFSMSAAGIHRAWRRGSAFDTGAAYGGLLGLVAGGVGGWAAGEAFMLGTGPRTSLAVAGGIAGALCGTVTGALIGAPFRRWKTVYKAKSRRRARLVFTGSEVGLALTF